MKRSCHGYEILNTLNSLSPLNWRVSASQLYVLLKKIEKKGYVVSSIQDQDNRPSKRIFTITKKGEKEFMNWLHIPQRNARDIRIDFLLKLFFFHDLKAF